jgi:hypothetical protein
MGHIVVISEEPLFAEALSAIISRELGVEVTTMENARPLAKLDLEQVDAVVASTSVPPAWASRLVSYKAGEPKRITAILSDIASQISDRGQQNLMLTDMIGISEKTKKLERSDTGASVDLTEKELALLLFIREEIEATREDILKNVWGFAPDVTTHTLETHIYRLRQKWRELAEDDPIIATDKGYRWNDQ